MAVEAMCKADADLRERVGCVGADGTRLGRGGGRDGEGGDREMLGASPGKGYLFGNESATLQGEGLVFGVGIWVRGLRG